jgi:hypothetical protein
MRGFGRGRRVCRLVSGPTGHFYNSWFERFFIRLGGLGSGDGVYTSGRFQSAVIQREKAGISTR